MHKTYQPTAKEITREKHEVDADGAVLGRLASEVAQLLMGKHKATFSKHMDNGDFVTIKNADKIRVTGRKEDQKMYYSHSGYPGGFKAVPYSDMKKKHPERILELAVKRMLPKNRLQSERMKRLTVELSKK